MRLGSSGVRDLLPVPAAVDFMPWPGWDLIAAAATWWLRRSTGKKARAKGPYLGLLLASISCVLYEHAPAPLLVLALADDAPLQPLSRYVVERGVAVHRISGEDLNYDWVPYGPDEEDVRPQFHDHD